MVCLKETITSVRLLEEPVLVLGEIWLCRKPVRTNSQPQSRWECCYSLRFWGGRRDKKEKHWYLCKKASKKGRNTLQRKIPGRKKSLLENNLCMRPGVISCGKNRTGKAEKLAHEESEQTLLCVASVARTAERLSRYFQRTGMSSRHISPWNRDSDSASMAPV